MWIADQWQDYELLDCGGGEKLERWDKQFLVRPEEGRRLVSSRPGLRIPEKAESNLEKL